MGLAGEEGREVESEEGRLKHAPRALAVPAVAGSNACGQCGSAANTEQFLRAIPELACIQLGLLVNDDSLISHSVSLVLGSWVGVRRPFHHFLSPTRNPTWLSG